MTVGSSVRGDILRMLAARLRGWLYLEGGTSKRAVPLPDQLHLAFPFDASEVNGCSQMGETATLSHCDHSHPHAVLALLICQAARCICRDRLWLAAERGCFSRSRFAACSHGPTSRSVHSS